MELNTTYRERREAKVDRLREWADKREAKSAAAFEKSRQISDMIPFGQPILVGHHSERHARRDQDRIENGMRKGIENGRKASEFQSRAANIEDALDRSIYADDPDAAEALTARIADLEAERARIKAYNASCRKGIPDFTLLDDAQRAVRRDVAKLCAWQLGKKGEMPAYVSANLSGRISANRKRLAGMAAGYHSLTGEPLQPR